jgi:hypothetical protein
MCTSKDMNCADFESSQIFLIFFFLSAQNIWYFTLKVYMIILYYGIHAGLYFLFF